MPQIDALPPITETPAPDDLVPLHNASTGNTEKISLSQLTGYPTLGWVAASQTWLYSSWDSTNKTGVITVPTDATAKYNEGMKIQISQSTGGTKYGFITKVTATTLTVYFGTDYTLNNETISSPMYSTEKSPFGFPLNPAKWSVTASYTNDRTPANSASLTSFTDTLVAPIGLFTIRMRISVSLDTSSTSSRYARWTLSSDASTETNPNTTVTIKRDGETTTSASVGGTLLSAPDTVSNAAPTTYTLMGYLSSTTGVNNFAVLGSTDIPSKYYAVCAYL